MNALTITLKRRAVLVRLSDQDWHYLRDVAGCTLAGLFYAGLIRCDNEAIQMIERNWTITGAGLAALEASK